MAEEVNDMVEEEVKMPNIDINQFEVAQGIEDDDFVVISDSSGESMRLQVALLRAALTYNITPAIKEGVWWIGELNTEVVAEGQTPMFRKGALGIEWKYVYEDNSSWRLLVPLSEISFKFSDLTEEQRESISLKYEDLTPEEIAELQKPANDMIDVLTQTNTNISNAEAERAAAEKSRVEAEKGRVSSESTRSSQESTRESNEKTRKDNEQGRINAETARKTEFNTLREEVLGAAQTAEDAAESAKNTPKIQDGTWWIWNTASGTYVNTYSPATGRSPKIQDGTWWTWDDASGSYVNTNVSVSSQYELTKQKVENVLTGNIESHRHDQYMKSDALDDIEDIRQGAALGKTALQSVPSEYVTETKLEGMGFATDEDIESKQDKNLYFNNVEASNWVDSTEYLEFPYQCDIICEGVDDTMFASVAFSMEQAMSGAYSIICETRANVVRIWSTRNVSITIPSIVIQK